MNWQWKGGSQGTRQGPKEIFDVAINSAPVENIVETRGMIFFFSNKRPERHRPLFDM